MTPVRLGCCETRVQDDPQQVGLAFFIPIPYIPMCVLSDEVVALKMLGQVQILLQPFLLMELALVVDRPGWS